MSAQKRPWVDVDTGGGFAAFVGLLLVGVATLVLLVGVTVNVVARHQQQVACRKWARVHEVPTKFGDYGFWSYDCLARTPSGEWINTDAWSTTVLQGQAS